MSGLCPIDLKLLVLLEGHNLELRIVLCTAARLGVFWRRREPERCSAWLEQLEAHPYYKAGQVLFDLLEWEDFMLDGEQVTPSISALLDAIQRYLPAISAASPLEVPLEDLPSLEPGFYLYRDVVLGVILLVADSAAKLPQ